MQALTSGQPHDQDIHQCGKHDTRDPCDQSETGTAAVPERSVGKLLTHLQADQEEEDDHQAVVDPVMQIHVQAERAEIEPDIQVPQRKVSVGQRRVCPHERHDRDDHQQHRSTRLRAQIVGNSSPSDIRRGFTERRVWHVLVL